MVRWFGAKLDDAGAVLYQSKIPRRWTLRRSDGDYNVKPL